MKLMNWQHSTMYLFFGIYGTVLLVTTATNLVPVAVNRLALSIALFVEGERRSAARECAQSQFLLIKREVSVQQPLPHGCNCTQCQQGRGHVRNPVRRGTAREGRQQ